MPIFRKLNPNEVQTIERPPLGQRARIAQQYDGFLAPFAPGDYGRVDLDPEDKRLTVRNRLQASATRRGLTLRFRRTNSTTLIFQVGTPEAAEEQAVSSSDDAASSSEEETATSEEDSAAAPKEGAAVEGVTAAPEVVEPAAQSQPAPRKPGRPPRSKAPNDAVHGTNGESATPRRKRQRASANANGVE